MWPVWGAREETGKKRISTSYYLPQKGASPCGWGRKLSLQEKRKFSFLGLESGERGRRTEKVILGMRESEKKWNPIMCLFPTKGKCW